jgi:hypothetical protein
MKQPNPSPSDPPKILRCIKCTQNTLGIVTPFEDPGRLEVEKAAAHLFGIFRAFLLG